MLPPEIISYIIVHELSHIIEPNHSKSFGTLLESQIHNLRKKKEWLKNQWSTYYTVLIFIYHQNLKYILAFLNQFHLLIF